MALRIPRPLNEAMKDAARIVELEQIEPAPLPALNWGSERVTLERLPRQIYVELRRMIDGTWSGNQASSLPDFERDAPPARHSIHLYVLRDQSGAALGMCEFDRTQLPQIELKSFGALPEAQKRGLDGWLLATALQGEWRSNPDRIWLRTDLRQDPSTFSLFERAGFRPVGGFVSSRAV